MKLLEKYSILPLDIIRYINEFIKYEELNDGNIKYAVTMWYFHKDFALEVYGHISYWNTSRITDMSFLFYQYYTFNEDISRWNVSNVTNMSLMFCGANSFNSDLSSWNVSNVTGMEGMFCNANSFNCDLSSWDVRNVTDMGWMFDKKCFTHHNFMTIFGYKKVPEWYSGWKANS